MQNEAIGFVLHRHNFTGIIRCRGVVYLRRPVEAPFTGAIGKIGTLGLLCSQMSVF
jgi:hypothetical protein